jgi:hypothetical protein
MALNEDPIPFSKNGKLWDTRRVTAPDSIASPRILSYLNVRRIWQLGLFDLFARRRISSLRAVNTENSSTPAVALKSTNLSV